MEALSEEYKRLRRGLFCTTLGAVFGFSDIIFGMVGYSVIEQSWTYVIPSIMGFVLMMIMIFACMHIARRMTRNREEFRRLNIETLTWSNDGLTGQENRGIEDYWVAPNETDYFNQVEYQRLKANENSPKE